MHQGLYLYRTEVIVYLGGSILLILKPKVLQLIHCIALAKLNLQYSVQHIPDGDGKSMRLRAYGLKLYSLSRLSI